MKDIRESQNLIDQSKLRQGRARRRIAESNARIGRTHKRWERHFARRQALALALAVPFDLPAGRIRQQDLVRDVEMLLAPKRFVAR
jgi:hypothetical protein